MPTWLRHYNANQSGRIGYCCVVMKLSITAPIYARACTTYHPAFSVRIAMHVGQHRSTIRAARTNGQHAVWERRFAHHGRGCTRELVSRLPSFTCFVPLLSVADLNANGLGMEPSSALRECVAKVGCTLTGRAHVAGLVPSAPTSIHRRRGSCTKLLSAWGMPCPCCAHELI